MRRDMSNGLVSHAVNDVVNSQAKSQRGVALGIPRAIGPLPGVTHIGVMADGNDNTAAIIANGAPFGHAAVGSVAAASPDVSSSWYLKSLVPVIEDMESL